MRMHNLSLPVLAVLALGLSGAAVTGCHEETEAKVATTPPPPPPPAPPAPPPPASTAAATPPPPPPPAPPPAPMITLKGIAMKSATQIDMPGAIDFQSGSAKILMNDASKKVLTQITTVLKDNPQILVSLDRGEHGQRGREQGLRQHEAVARPRAVGRRLHRQAGHRQEPSDSSRKRLEEPARGQRHPGAHGRQPPRGVPRPRVQRQARRGRRRIGGSGDADHACACGLHRSRCRQDAGKEVVRFPERSREASPSRDRPRVVLRVPGIRGLGPAGHLHAERGPLLGRRLHVHAATVSVGDLPHDV